MAGGGETVNERHCRTLSLAPTGRTAHDSRQTIDATGLATLDRIAQGGVAGGYEDGKPATEVKVKSVLLD